MTRIYSGRKGETERIEGCVVLFGPEGAGKRTNLKHIHEKNPVHAPHWDQEEEGAKYHLLPWRLPGRIAGTEVSLTFWATEEPPLTFPRLWESVDTVVFVADSCESRREENKRMFAQIQGLSDVPFIIQWNKRDMFEAAAVKDLTKDLWADDIPAEEAVAVRGEGVMETVKQTVKAVLARLRGSQRM